MFRSAWEDPCMAHDAYLEGQADMVRWLIMPITGGDYAACNEGLIGILTTSP